MAIVGFYPKYHGPVIPTAPSGGLILSLETPIAGLNDGDVVSTWPDDSSFHDDFSDLNVTQPIYKSASETINGVPTIKFYHGSPTPQRLYSPHAPSQFTGLSGTNGATIYIVGKVSNDPPTSPNEFGLYKVNAVDASVFSIHNRIPSVDSHIYDKAFSDSVKDIGNPMPSLASPFCYATFTKTNLFTARLNGNQIFTTSTCTFEPTNSAPLDDGNIWIGSDNDVASGSGNYCWISLFKIWDHVLDATEIAQMDAYVYNKFLITN
jgi:hypothetical protein